MNALQLQLLVMIFSGWVNRSQQDVIEYLQEENRVLREQLGGKPLRFTDQQRRRLAAKARSIGRKRLFEIGTLVTPDTLLRWYRKLIAREPTISFMTATLSLHGRSASGSSPPA
jgi:hypothetical protein